ncbi:MAG: hypothetical protein ACKVG9_01845, partial [Rhodospirillales bacterium]
CMHKTLLPCLLPVSLLLIISCGSDSDNGGGSSVIDLGGSNAATDEGIDGVNDLINDLAGAPENTSANLAAAHSSFQEAVSLNPDNGTARMFLAATTMSSFFEEGQASITTSTLGGLLDGFGFGPTNRSLSDLASGLIPTTPSGNFDSGTPNLGQVQDWLADEIFWDLFDTIANHLEAVPQSFRDTITIDGIDIEIDCADARMIAAQVRLAQVAALTFMAFDFDMNLTAVNDDWLVRDNLGEQTRTYVPYRLSSGGNESQATDGFVVSFNDQTGDYEYLHVDGFNPRPSLIGTPSTGASNFLKTTAIDRMNLARIRLQWALENILVAGPLLRDETANQRENGVIAIDEGAAGINAFMTWITPMPEALDSSVAVLIPSVPDPNSSHIYPAIELRRQMLTSQTYSGRPFLPDNSFATDGWGIEKATAASFEFSNLKAVWTEVTGQDLLEAYSGLAIAFESAMNGASQVHKGWQSEDSYYGEKEVGNWQYSEGVFPQENIFGFEW